MKTSALCLHRFITPANHRYGGGGIIISRASRTANHGASLAAKSVGTAGWDNLGVISGERGTNLYGRKDERNSMAGKTNEPLWQERGTILYGRKEERTSMARKRNDRTSMARKRNEPLWQERRTNLYGTKEERTSMAGKRNDPL
ncbi:hypothetical protein ACOMHN_048028 [Nucella lapillus]